MDVQTGSPPRTAFFHHGPHREPSTAPMQSLTRYLCAAMYLNKGMCDAVIGEYVHERYRAVVPSHGFDLEPVIRHARRAQRMRVVRDGLIIGLWLVLSNLVGSYLYFYLVVLCYVSVLRAAWRRLSWRVRFGFVVVVPVLVVLASGSSVAAILFQSTDIAEVMSRVVVAVVAIGIAFMIVSMLFAVVVVGHLAFVLRSLSRRLGPGAHGPGPGGAGGGRFGNVLAYVRASQSGNITLCAGDNPFIGAGDPHSPDAKVWSVVVELDRKASDVLGKSASAEAAVDPVVMHDRIRAKLHGMRDERPPGGDGERPLPPGERVNGLVTGWHLAARGRCVQRPRPVDDFTAAAYTGHPLIDPQGRLPYSMASEEAVEAAIRHPQGGVRCFQRVSIGAQGQSIRTPDGEVVAPAEEQDAVMSAFVHLAVEGRMLYAQFAVTVLPPVHPDFKIVDELPDWSGPKLLGRAFGLSLPTVFVAPLLAPYRFVAALARIVGEKFAAETAPDPTRDLVHDYGARISVRELAADDGVHDFVQELDVDKYTRLIERRVNEALLDYLGDECGIDVSAYRTQAGVILNDGVIMTGGTVHGQVAAGTHVDQRQSGPGGGGRINP